MLLSLPLQIATKCACPSVPLGLMRHVETAVDVTRLQPLRTSVSSLEGARRCCSSANPLDDVQLHTYIGWMATPSRSYVCYALAARKSARHLSRLYDSHWAPAGLSGFAILDPEAAEGAWATQDYRVGSVADHGADKFGSRSETAPSLRLGRC
jgi:hypothetical protein